MAREKARNDQLTCYAYADGNEWEAICVNFDVVVNANSFEEVTASLIHSLRLFAETVSELPPEERRRFLERRTSWHVRTRLAVMAFFFRMSYGGPHKFIAQRSWLRPFDGAAPTEGWPGI